MKKSIILTAAFALSLFFAQAQNLKTPPASPTQYIKQDIGIGAIELSYNRPSAKGRVIFGDLVPYGKAWRLGANAATKLTLDADATVGGKEVKAGSYAVYAIPTANEWEIILNKGINNWGLGGYSEADDVARFKVATIKLPIKAETLSMQFADLKDNGASLAIWWENTMVQFPIVIANEAKILADIDKVMNKDNKPYFQAAEYYYNTGKDLTQALAWANKAIDNNPKAFWIMLLKAKIQAKLGDKAGAIATSKKSSETAKEAKNEDYVALNNKFQASLK
jgi:tetratricopeptide (TPR) repeat protein